MASFPKPTAESYWVIPGRLLAGKYPGGKNLQDMERRLGALLNAVGDFGLTDNVALYGGAGIGVAWVDVTEETTFEEEDGPFLAWQAKAGLRWYASRSVSWSLGYRFLNIDDAEIEDDLGASDFDLETQRSFGDVGGFAGSRTGGAGGVCGGRASCWPRTSAGR